ncbi:MAG: hypothetical protein ACK56F_24450 [bacterium]
MGGGATRACQYRVDRVDRCPSPGAPGARFCVVIYIRGGFRANRGVVGGVVSPRSLYS